MKITRKQTTLLLSMFVMACIGAVYAQTRTVKIVKGEEVLFSYPAEQIDFMTVVNQLEQPIGLKTEMGDNSITVTWNAVPGAEAYVVSRSGDGQNYTELAQVKTTTYVDNNPLNGENHYRVKAIGTGMVSSEETTTSTPANFGQLESGMYVGIIGFNKKLYTLPIQLLNSSTKSEFDTYIDNLTNSSNGTALYYAVDNAISILQANQYPEDICNASVITFTDGLDNFSLTLQSNLDYSTEQYLADVHDKILTERVQGQSIAAYAVGVMAKDVIDETEFNNNLSGLSSSEDNKTLANDMTDVNNTFRDIANELYNTSFMQSVSVCIPWGYNQGTQIRLTFDVVRQNDEYISSEKAEASKKYIDANIYRTSQGVYLRNIKCEGLTMEESSEISGYIVEEEGPNEGLACFTMNGIVCDDNSVIAKKNILAWHGDPYQIESEFDPGENTEIIEHKKTAAILLVLDCTSSLEETSFANLKKCAKTFINTLVQGYQAPVDPSNPSDPDTPTGSVRSYTANGVTFNMVYVEGGTFQMGATSEQSNGYSPYDDEKPVHSVTLDSYYIGQTEVTQELWKAVMGASPSSSYSWSSSYGLGDQYPAYYISYDECKTFISKLNTLTGANFRMPTEAEWEYAARGGNKSKGYIFSGSNTIGDVAWYRSNSGSKTHEVATKNANELGIYDMSGNVWEWCSDWYGSYSSGLQTNPTGPSTGSCRVFRGGSWSFNATNCRVALRYYGAPDGHYGDLGLRLCQ